MAVQDTPRVGEMAGLQAAPMNAKPVRRLPVQKDWPLWAIVTTQIGILVGIIGLWEIGARAGVVDGFFWSQPSAIARTFVIFFTEGDAWTDISFTFRSTILGFIIGTTTGLYQYDSGKLSFIAGRDRLAFPDIRAIAEGRDGTLWLGMSGGGLARLQGNTLHQFTKRY